ncbi:MAG TPA: phosphoribosylanthranilate isomerase [Acidimicrobiales bacterium]|nr:phosphoribosylanthranilate isomerase [Acidimicrobiales bacterium]
MKIKICGTTSEDDALLAVALDADLVGFIFAPSPRQIAPQQAADIAKRLPHEVVPVGVFRDELPQRVVEIAQRSGMRAVQLHGEETAEQTRWIRERIPFVIKAFAAGDARLADAGHYHADVILLDAPHPGSGRVFDWALAGEAPTGHPVMIAGGLHAGNVADAVARTRPWGVDVVTGVERAPGVKDPIKLRAFVAAARAAEREVAAEDGPATDQDDTGSQPYDWDDGRV